MRVLYRTRRFASFPAPRLNHITQKVAGLSAEAGRLTMISRQSTLRLP